MNNLQARAARIAEEAKAETPRYVSGTEPVKKYAPVRPMSNSQRNRDAGQSTIDSIRESLK